jgi:protein-S-isoprenylcysteine O-methyltransferase Ste14
MDSTHTSHVLLPTLTASQFQVNTEPFNQTVICGALGVLVALIGILVAALQLRHMQQKRNFLEIFALA